MLFGYQYKPKVTRVYFRGQEVFWGALQQSTSPVFTVAAETLNWLQIMWHFMSSSLTGNRKINRKGKFNRQCGHVPLLLIMPWIYCLEHKLTYDLRTIRTKERKIKVTLLCHKDSTHEITNFPGRKEQVPSPVLIVHANLFQTLLSCLLDSMLMHHRCTPNTKAVPESRRHDYAWL